AEEVSLGSVKDDDGTDVFGIGGGEVQRIIGAQREANHCQAALSLSGTFAKKLCCLRDLGLDLEVVGVHSTAKNFRIGDGVCDLAVIQVWGEGHEALSSESIAHSFDCVVQPPPGVKGQYTGPFASGWYSEKTIRLRPCHMGLLISMS